jgi:hypothetical protein
MSSKKKKGGGCQKFENTVGSFENLHEINLVRKVHIYIYLELYGVMQNQFYQIHGPQRSTGATVEKKKPFYICLH